jgi:hypothetical protein
MKLSQAQVDQLLLIISDFDRERGSPHNYLDLEKALLKVEVNDSTSAVYKCEWFDKVAWSWQRAYVVATNPIEARNKLEAADSRIHTCPHNDKDSFRAEVLPEVFLMDEIEYASIIADY